MLLTQDLVANAHAVGSFVEDDRERLSYGELARRVAEIAQSLSAHPWAAPGRVVALALSNDIASIAAFLALLDRSVSVALLPADDGAATPGFCSARLDPATLGASDMAAGGGAATGPAPRVYFSTSGSTGEPKWVIVGREALIAGADGLRERARLSARDRVLIPVPVHHSYGLSTALVPSFLAAASVRVSARGDPLSIMRAERSADPTVAFMIPSQCRALLPLRRTKRRYRGIFVASGRLSPEFVVSFEDLNGPVAGIYGCTELGSIAVADPAAPAERRHRDIGPPLRGVEIVIAPDKAGGRDESGQVLVRHHAAFLGYADARGEVGTPTADFHPTGDLGRISKHGDLSVLGRIDNRVKRDGLWVLLGDIEACLADAAGIAEVAVVTAGETRRGAGIVAYCVPRSGAVLTRDALLRHCRDALPGHAVPDRVVVLDALARLASGKVDLKALVRDALTRTGA